MLKDIYTTCLTRDEKTGKKSITHFWVNQNSPYQFQTLNIYGDSDGLIIRNEIHSINGISNYEPFPIYSSNNRLYNAWARLMNGAKVSKPETTTIQVPRNGVLLGGDVSEEVIAMYEPEGLLQWNLHFGGHNDVTEILIAVNGANQISAKVQREFVQLLRDASKNNYSEVRKQFDSMLEEATAKGR